jgi:hypothetical protein
MPLESPGKQAVEQFTCHFEPLSSNGDAAAMAAYYTRDASCWPRTPN